ncbi:MAG: AAA family ATPase [Anaerolineales bacterium]|nr:AAA family ATPase [Anaerolineales bacterium]
MYLSHLTLQYFRSLYNIDLPLKPLTIIIGPNASGKSNLFHALRFLYDAVVGDRLDWQVYDSQIDDLRWYGLDDFGKRPDKLHFNLRYSEAGTDLVNYHTVFQCGDYLEIVEEILKIHVGNELFPYFERQGENIHQRIGYRGNVLKNPYYSRARSNRNLHLREEGPSLIVPLPQLVYKHITGWRFFDVDLQQARRETFIPQYPEEVPPLSGNASNLSAFLYALYQRRYDDYTAIIDKMTDFIELPQSLMVEHDAERGGQNARYRFIEQPFSENRLIPPTSMSDGTIRLLALLALLLADHTVTLACLEEPDHGLHPRLMLYLADIVRQAIEAPLEEDEAVGTSITPPQIIITTHSPEFMDCFDLAAEADYLQVYIADRDEDGKTLLTPTTAEEFAPWLEKYRLGEAVRRRFI